MKARRILGMFLLCVTAAFVVACVIKGSPPIQPEVWSLLAGPLEADDPQVLEVLKKHYLDPPSLLPYNFTRGLPEKGFRGFTWPWIHGWLQKLFAGQRGGFFVEAGALDGEYLSNTLWLERDLGWSGLLVEAADTSFKELRHKQRKSWASNACLSPAPYPKRITFVNHFLTNTQLNMNDFSRWAYRGHSHEFRQDIPQADFGAHDHASYSVVQCFPLLSYLKALNVTQVDLLSLDTQGSEADIVRSFLGSDGIKVRVIVAENEFGKFDKKMMNEMRENGYLLLASLTDLVFVRKDDPVWQQESLVRILQDDTGQINGYKMSFEDFNESQRRDI